MRGNLTMLSPTGLLRLLINNKSLQRKMAVWCSISIALMLIVYQCTHVTNSEKIGKVNITGIVNQFVQSQIKVNESDILRKKHIKVFGHQLELILQRISKNEHVVLLPSEAVIAGAKDYTEAVQQELKKILKNDDSD